MFKRLCLWFFPKRASKPVLVVEGQMLFSNDRLEVWNNNQFWFLRQKIVVLKFTTEQFQHICYLLSACLIGTTLGGYGVFKIRGNEVLVSNPWEEEREDCVSVTGRDYVDMIKPVGKTLWQS